MGSIQFRLQSPNGRPGIGHSCAPENLGWICYFYGGFSADVNLNARLADALSGEMVAPFRSLNCNVNLLLLLNFRMNIYFLKHA